MVNELTKLSTDGGLKINAKKTKVMTNIAEIEIRLNVEALECTRIDILRTTDIIPAHLGERNQMGDWNGLEQYQETRVHTGRQIPKPRGKETRPGILRIPGPFIQRPNVVAHGEGKEDAPNLSAEDGTKNTARCMERLSDEC
jgi:hypothetical protein